MFELTVFGRLDITIGRIIERETVSLAVHKHIGRTDCVKAMDQAVLTYRVLLILAAEAWRRHRNTAVQTQATAVRQIPTA